MSEELWTDEGADDLAPVRVRRPRVSTDGARHIGCPIWWFRLVFPIMRGKNELAVAIYLYRLRAVQRTRTVIVTNERLLAELGINRFAKYRALQRLAKAGIITLRRRDHRSYVITFCRRPRKRAR